MALAKQRNVYLGRVRRLSAAQVDELRRSIMADERKTVLARKLGITRTTVYEYMKGKPAMRVLCSTLDGSELEAKVIGGEHRDEVSGEIDLVETFTLRTTRAQPSPSWSAGRRCCPEKDRTGHVMRKPKQHAAGAGRRRSSHMGFALSATR